MRLKSYITESYGKSLSEDEARQWLKENKDVVEATPIYRGIDDPIDHILYLDPTKYTRVSANTKNYYTLMFDNMSSWKKYPKRSKSIIGTLRERAAEDYGKIYRVFPKSGSKIGVCPKADLWISFEYSGVYSLNDFISMLDEIFEYRLLTKNYGLIKDPNTFNELLANFDTIDMWVKELWLELENNMDKDEENEIYDHAIYTIENIIGPEMFDINDELHDIRKQFIEEIVINQKSMFDYYSDVFNPDRNGFKLYKAGQDIPMTSSSNEVWTDGPSLMILNTLYEQEFER